MIQMSNMHLSYKCRGIVGGKHGGDVNAPVKVLVFSTLIISEVRFVTQNVTRNSPSIPEGETVTHYES